VVSIAAGIYMQFTDAFRLVKVVEGRKRTIFVKLHSVWDHKHRQETFDGLVLGSARQLAGVDEFRRKVFVDAN
jgi:hypothetical protein